MNWWWEMAPLWLSSIMDPEGNGVVMILVQWPPTDPPAHPAAFLWGPHYAFTALQDYFGVPNSSAQFEKLWFCTAKKEPKCYISIQFQFSSNATLPLRMQMHHSFKWTHWTLNDFFTLFSSFSPLLLLYAVKFRSRLLEGKSKSSYKSS